MRVGTVTEDGVFVGWAFDGEGKAIGQEYDGAGKVTRIAGYTPAELLAVRYAQTVIGELRSE